MADSYNPIIGKDKLPRLRLFHPRPVPEPGVALVLVGEGQPLVTLRQGERMTAGEVVWGKYSTIYKVNTGEYSFHFSCTIPCESDAFDFKAEVNVTCFVDKPATIVERTITDVRATLEPLITGTMRSVSRRYEVQQSSAAEIAVAEAIEREKNTYNVGIKISRVIVRLHLEEDARNYIREQEEIRRRTTLGKAELEHKREMETAEASLEEERRKFREAQASWEREQVEQKERAEIRLQEMRMEFYKPLIQEGNWQLLALHLTKHPDDTPGVIKSIREQRAVELDYNLKVLDQLLSKADLEEWEVNAPVMDMLKHIASVLKSEVGLPLLSERREKHEQIPEKAGHNDEQQEDSRTGSQGDQDEGEETEDPEGNS